MRDSWLNVVGRVLEPRRPRLAPCVAERERHLAAQRRRAEVRSRALADCVARIEGVRAEVFAAKDGVVSSRMTDLEREWRRLSRTDPDGDLMDLWLRIAPRSWIDQKRWRAGAPASRVELATALASDVEGVERAEAAATALRRTNGAVRIHWRLLARDFADTDALLSEPLRAATEVLALRDGSAVATAHAEKLRQNVEAAALLRFPERPTLARAIAYTAYVDTIWRAARLDEEANPTAPLHAVWSAGYVLGDVDPSGVTLESPPF
jgi:hypothetical protein